MSSLGTQMIYIIKIELGGVKKVVTASRRLFDDKICICSK